MEQANSLDKFLTKRPRLKKNNPRSKGTNPRAKGTNPNAMKEKEKNNAGII